MSAVILFSGQGLQQQHHVLELRQYCQQFDIEDALKQVLPQLFSTHLETIDLYQNDFAQPFIFALQWCRWQLLQHQLLDISHVAGYSLGELSALLCSTETDFKQGLKLAHKRAQLMSQASQGNSALTAIQGINYEKLQQLFELTQTYLAIKINDSSVIVGGKQSHLEALEHAVQQQGASIKRLQVSIPSHTCLMQAAVGPYQDYIQQQIQSNLTIPILSGTQGYCFYQSQPAIQALVYQMDHAIDWDLCHASILESMPEVILELGPGSALSKMLQHNQHIHVRAWDDFKSVEGLMTWLSRCYA